MLSQLTRRALLASSAALAQGRRRRPNVVVILTDNHGAWTLGCYGNPDVPAPNLDRLAGEGKLFTHPRQQRRLLGQARQPTHRSDAVVARRASRCHLPHNSVLSGIRVRSEDVALAMSQKEFRETRGSSMTGRLVETDQLAQICDNMGDWSKHIDHFWPAQVRKPSQALFERSSADRY